MTETQVEGKKSRTRPPCTVDGCSKPVNGQGLCNAHYGRARTAGTLARPLTTEQRFWSRIDKVEGCWNWTGTINDKGYGTLGVKTGATWYPVLAYRMSYEMAHGPIPDGEQVDHKCRNRLCVNPDHLRAVTRKQNNENLGDSRANNKTGYRGVYVRYGKFVASVRHKGKGYQLGYFDTAEEAAEVARAKRLELFTHNEEDRSRAALTQALGGDTA